VATPKPTPPKTKTPTSKKIVTPIAEKRTAAEKRIAAEMIAVPGKPADIGGYYQPDDAKASAALRPAKRRSPTSSRPYDRGQLTANLR